MGYADPLQSLFLLLHGQNTGIICITEKNVISKHDNF